jgi:hypothetical protein
MEDKKKAVETALLQALDKAGAIDDSRMLGLDMKLVDGAVRSLLAFEMITCEVRAGAAGSPTLSDCTLAAHCRRRNHPPTSAGRFYTRCATDTRSTDRRTTQALRVPPKP